MNRRLTTPSLPRSMRVLAALLAVMVWALGVFAVSPDLHEALHAHDGDGHSEKAAPTHTCAVTLFAQGAEMLAGAPELESPTGLRLLGGVALPPVFAWTAPDHRLAPSCGPPRG